MLTDERINEITALEQAATPGPWRRKEQDNYDEIFDANSWGKALNPLALVGVNPCDAAFIAQSRQIVPELLAEIKQLRAELEQKTRDVAQLAIESVKREMTLAKLEAEVIAVRDSTAVELEMAINDILDAAITPCTYCKLNPVNGGICNMRNEDHDMFACWQWRGAQPEGEPT